MEIGQQLLELKPEANMGVEFSQIKYATRTLEFSECTRCNDSEYSTKTRMPEFMKNGEKPIKQITFCFFNQKK